LLARQCRCVAYPKKASVRIFANQARTAAGLNQSSKLSLAMIVLLVDLDSGVSLLVRAFSQPHLSNRYQISGSMTIPKTCTFNFYDKGSKKLIK
jgi:hypothetical protein